MISDLDIRRAANLLIRQHGKDVETEARRRADWMLGRSDLDGNSVWKRIGRTIIASQASAKDPLHREIERPRPIPSMPTDAVDIVSERLPQPFHPLRPNAIHLGFWDWASDPVEQLQFPGLLNEGDSRNGAAELATVLQLPLPQQGLPGTDQCR